MPLPPGCVLHLTLLNSAGRPRKARKRKAPVSDDEEDDENDNDDDGESNPPVDEKVNASEGAPSEHDGDEEKGEAGASEAEEDVVSRRTRSRAQASERHVPLRNNANRPSYSGKQETKKSPRRQETETINGYERF